jgi:hypothetical protein
MKHKTYLEPNDGDLTQLAENLGDLRYDTLSEFLGLLSDKINRDAVKDKERGRQRLASSLFSCQAQLKESGKHIEMKTPICSIIIQC